ncbi:hypothetical protein L916_10556, partial [Phytophthora nicotianae]
MSALAPSLNEGQKNDFDTVMQAVHSTEEVTVWWKSSQRVKAALDCSSLMGQAAQ